MSKKYHEYHVSYKQSFDGDDAHLRTYLMTTQIIQFQSDNRW